MRERMENVKVYHKKALKNDLNKNVICILTK